jgi:phosphatidylserine decarboxylase
MIAGTAILLAVGFALSLIYWPAGFAVIPLIVWLFAFFRDPNRTIPTDPDVMVSPADGTVSDITEIGHFELLGAPCVRIGIFLSVFNVHINRSPCDGVVVDVIYKEGKFINALKHNEASEQNESNTLVLADSANRRIAVVRQIVGLIARRIVCDPQPGQTLQKGQRIGMIKFGSRTELYIPKSLSPQVAVQVGQKVRGGCDILARVRG